MKVFLDTNILLDVLGHREPFYAAAAEIWALAEQRRIQAFVSAISFNNVFYIVRNLDGRTKAQKSLRLIRNVFESVAPDTHIINQAIDTDIADFEDAIQFHSAVRARTTCIITRNPGDFPKTDLPIHTPDEFLAFWHSRTR
jgi:predicted nucleic acid-binding protein